MSPELEKLFNPDGTFTKENAKKAFLYLKTHNDYTYLEFAKVWIAVKAVATENTRGVIPTKRKEEIFLSFPEVQDAVKRGLTLMDVESILKYGKTELVLPTCPECGNPIHAHPTRYFAKHCSFSCGAKSSRGKFFDTMMKRYGVKHATQHKAFLAKSEETCMKKFGYKNVLYSPEFRQRIKKTNLEKYGAEYIFCKESSLRKELDKKQIEKYGSPGAWLQSPEGRAYLQNKFLDRSYENLLKLENVEPLFPREDWHGNAKNSDNMKYPWRCKLCGRTFYASVGYLLREPPRCYHCFPVHSGNSTLQKEIIEFIRSVTSEQINERVRTIISPLELDIVLPERMLAIEVNGVYWHSEQMMKEAKKSITPSKYHLRKTELCAKKGFELIHIFEHEWLNNRSAIENRLRALLKNDEVYYARKCSIRELGVDEANAFLDEYHTQGSVDSLIRFGLFYKEELVAVMTFGKPKSKKFEYELQRYASRGRVIGGVSKLYKHFVKKYNPKSITSYACRAWTEHCQMYKAIGLEKTKTLKPAPTYIHHPKTGIMDVVPVHSKGEIKKYLGENYNPELSAEENMTNFRCFKIYDCGAYEFSKVYH